MKSNADTPIFKDLVLIGGGHSHVAVLKRFGMKPLPGVRLTLITRDVHTPYSGMLPGYIAGHYGYDDSHIDLRPLAQFAGARLYHTAADGLDLANQRVLCAGRPPVAYDALSINIGSRPNTLSVPGAEAHTQPVKPIDSFLDNWQLLRERVQAAGGRFQVAVVGGGAGGVELSLAAQYRLRTILAEARLPTERLRFHLVSASDAIMPGHNPRARRKFTQVLGKRGVAVHAGSAVTAVDAGTLTLANGRTIAADAIFWVTNAAAQPWLGEAGLATDEGGFVKVDEGLQSLSHRAVFAVGDIAAVVDHPRPKSGVFAVRQGPPLAANLRRVLRGKAAKPFKPQTEFLSLVSTGDQYAVASRAGWSTEGRWVWRLKDWIDRRFMRRFSELPEMASEEALRVEPGVAGEQALKDMSAVAMRCGGCGAKVGSTVLSKVVNRLTPVDRNDVLIGLNAPDDAAVVEVPPGQVMAQSVDYFRAFIDDPYAFGRIAANHALGDLFAMGADPQSAMAIATVPFGHEPVVEEQLFQLMSGALDVLNECNCALVGGHSSEGAELAFGLSVSGLADKQALMTKGGMQPGDVLILTKPIGTGTLFAADMRQRARGRWVFAAVESMLVSNQAAAECLHGYGCTACTDVTGFGLLGHLIEMTRVTGVDTDIYPQAIPVLDGALETIRAGIFSSLQPENIRLRRAIRDIESASRHERYPLLFDPQTAGGLLASVPRSDARACLAELQRLGYSQAAVIGVIHSCGEALEPIRIVSGEPRVAPAPGRLSAQAG